jgi:RND family efflux transporter MFP subunit
MGTADRGDRERDSGAWRIVIIVFVVLACVGGWLFARRVEPKHEPAVRALSATGVLAASAATPVEARASGFIQAVYCAADMQVKKDQLCAKIDPRLYRAVADQDEAELTAAEARLGKDNADLAQAMAKRRSRETALARKAYEEARARKERDEETSAQRRAALNAAQIDLSKTDIVSPIDGTVISRNVETGQEVAAGAEAPLFLVAADLSVLRIDVNVGEKEIGAIKPGDKVSFTVAGLPNRTFVGEVTQISRSPQTGQNAASYDIVISAPNGDLSLKPGARATIQIMIDNGRDAPAKEKS